MLTVSRGQADRADLLTDECETPKRRLPDRQSLWFEECSRGMTHAMSSVCDPIEVAVKVCCACREQEYSVEPLAGWVESPYYMAGTVNENRSFKRRTRMWCGEGQLLPMSGRLGKVRLLKKCFGFVFVCVNLSCPPL